MQRPSLLPLIRSRIQSPYLLQCCETPQLYHITAEKHKIYYQICNKHYKMLRLLPFPVPQPSVIKGYQCLQAIAMSPLITTRILEMVFITTRSKLFFNLQLLTTAKQMCKWSKMTGAHIWERVLSQPWLWLKPTLSYKNELLTYSLCAGEPGRPRSNSGEPVGYSMTGLGVTWYYCSETPRTTEFLRLNIKGYECF